MRWQCRRSQPKCLTGTARRFRFADRGSQIGSDPGRRAGGDWLPVSDQAPDPEQSSAGAVCEALAGPKTPRPVILRRRRQRRPSTVAPRRGGVADIMYPLAGTGHEDRRPGCQGLISAALTITRRDWPACFLLLHRLLGRQLRLSGSGRHRPEARRPPDLPSALRSISRAVSACRPGHPRLEGRRPVRISLPGRQVNGAGSFPQRCQPAIDRETRISRWRAGAKPVVARVA